MAPHNKLEALQHANNFVSLKSIADGNHKKWSLVNVVGVAVDQQVPTPTHGTDWKCTIRIVDKSTEDSKEDAIAICCFRPQDSMPQLECGDVVVVYGVKIQQRDFEAPSLLTNFNSIIRVYTNLSIPKPPGNAIKALAGAWFPKNFSGSRSPGISEAEYVSQLLHSMDKSIIPTAAEWTVQVCQSKNVREKFRVLEKVEDGNFYDLVVQIIKSYDGGDKVNIWVSDYTENSAFFNHSFLNGQLSEEQTGDPFGYGAKFNKAAKADKQDWGGPYGKRSMQITCWGDHAAAIRDRIASGNWVLMRNVQVKYGRNGANLEGFLRTDRNPRGGIEKVRVSLLDPSEDPETIDPRLKEAIKRKRDYERSRKKELKEVQEAVSAGQKRKALLTSEANIENSKARRNKKRAQKKPVEKVGQAEEKVGQAEEHAESRQISPEIVVPAVNLNPHIKCENDTKQTSKVSAILDPVYHTIEVEGEEVRMPLPFANLNYRANVRVTDFRPSDLRDFAVSKKASEYDVLSDNDDSDYPSESDEDSIVSSTNRVWEWRFLLELEDASEGKPGEKIWVLVDNPSAQLLTNLDASNLRDDEDNLQALRQNLFILWGNLEEEKTARQAEAKRAQRLAANAERPPLDSSDNEAPPNNTKLTNRPFPCCIRQYGIKVKESDPDEANAGDGLRWERAFGLFGSRIVAA